MKEITPDDELKFARAYLEHGVFDALIKKCQAEPPICAVHERLKRAYIEHVISIKEAIDDGNLPRTTVEELKELGKWVFENRTLEGKEDLAGELCDVMSSSGAYTHTQVDRVRAEATDGHQGPDFPISMTRGQFLEAWQMHEDGLQWQEIANKFDSGPGNEDRMDKRMRPLRRIVKKCCPLQKRKQIPS